MTERTFVLDIGIVGVETSCVVVINPINSMVEIGNLRIGVVQKFYGVGGVGVPEEPGDLSCFGEIISDEERQQNHIRLQLQPLVNEYRQIVPQIHPGNYYVDQIDL